MKNDREVGGLWCHEVLVDLAAYVDDELDAARRTQVDAHLAGCDNCARFGGAYGEVVRGVQAGRAPGESPPEGVRTRLKAALDEALK